MAEVALHPAQGFPPGTKAKVFALPANGAQISGQPTGEQLSEPEVAADGTLTVKGLTEGEKYIAWRQSGGTDYYLRFEVVAPPASEGGVSSVNGKAGVVVLSAADVEAVGTASPAFTGTPTAPTPAEGDNDAKLATAKYADRAVATEATARATADALLLPKADNLASVASAATARGNLGLGTAATQASGAFDAAGAAAAAAAASQVRQTVHAALTAEATLEPDKLSPVDATAGALKEKLPTELGAGHVIVVEKKDATANEVTIEGNIRGEAAQSFVLKYAKETVVFMTDAAGSWWVVARYIALSSVKAATRTILRRTVSVPAGQVPGNEVLLDEYVKIAAGESRKILAVETHTASGTIKVKIARGEAGTTEIAAYNALEATEAIKLTESTQALSDKDRLRITTSGGAAPKGLTITWYEEVIAP